MTTNKERIENLETGLGGLQDSFSRMKLRLTDKMRLIEENLKRLSDTIASNREGSSNHHVSRPSLPPLHCEERSERDEGRTFYSRVANLEFPSFASGDPTEWLNRARIFFDFQATAP